MNPLALAAMIGLAVGSGAGWFVTDAVLGADIAMMQAEQADALAQSEQMYRRALAGEQERGFVLSDRLAHTESQLTQRTLEVSRALQKVTTGRACLDASAVRLLNGAAHDDGAMPETAGPSVAESAAIATDTDVAGWIGGAQYHYDTCRARLGALIDFETGRPDDRTEQ
ncbi:hypothetical protein NP590_04100 [Methylomonas sp. SURF-2]|uniref:Bacteriophage Rz lysis protein n=1 Tax=Methylomonas subterranea TaxID=2952225 RepID=A0ABT1TCV5_9GAMM|nr:hypothetical protein [Methylomonas sp. SURF-2]MCQ8103280.1 hypothetical protein [Methylomonas sp. SURF-2]